MELTYRFPDDRTESFEAFRYPKVAWLAIAEYMAVAGRAYGLPVSIQTFQRWLRLLLYVYALDRLLDDHPADRRLAAKDVIESSLRGDLLPLPAWVNQRQHVGHAHNLFWSSIRELGPSAESALLLAGSRGVEASKQKSQAKTVREHVKAIRLENHALADLAIALMTPQERNRNPRAVRKLRTYLRRLLTGFGVKDAMGDMRSDRDEKLVLVEPTEWNRRCLQGACRRSFLRLVVLHPRASAQVAWRTYALWRLDGADEWREWQQQVGCVAEEV